ncbi:solute carrier family 25 member 36 [Verticillium alfalfae VaMs.102]|uniref:Solute carrier family 25 member 36 n=1 Tax=Verticillium alfalfae (strain VaMs.102 / ATCC MYA-4576 / FGSC 10136) TaxID=526221 RepID=C9S912_VERA1|nr:solute carrier family 25 member 36 [Verticillium alfalfae VaMs.102]EEY14060.1 solute carrier family 25 member 36 [Verticillium alfalfae VaMs.102]
MDETALKNQPMLDAIALHDRDRDLDCSSPPLSPAMSDRNDAGLSPAVVESIAGLSAGSVATLVVHPLDIVKTRMQIHRSSTAPKQPLTTMSLIRSLTQNPHPVASLYRGLTPNLIGNASSWASFFFFKSRIERLLAGGTDRTTRDRTLSTPHFLLSAAGAGALTQVLTNPVWVLKTRMLSSDRGDAGAYPSMLAGARRILATEGWRGFYRGLAVGLVGVSHGAVQFAVYEPAKRVYLRARRAAGAPDDGRLGNDATVLLLLRRQARRRRRHLSLPGAAQPPAELRRRRALRPRRPRRRDPALARGGLQGVLPRPRSRCQLEA